MGEIVEIAKFTPEQVRSYEDSLKYYRDLKNSLDTAALEGKIEGKTEGRLEGKIEVAKEMLKEGEALEQISKYTGLTLEELKKL